MGTKKGAQYAPLIIKQQQKNYTSTTIFILSN